MPAIEKNKDLWAIICLIQLEPNYFPDPSPIPIDQPCPINGLHIHFSY